MNVNLGTQLLSFFDVNSIYTQNLIENVEFFGLRNKRNVKNEIVGKAPKFDDFFLQLIDYLSKTSLN